VKVDPQAVQVSVCPNTFAKHLLEISFAVPYLEYRSLNELQILFFVLTKIKQDAFRTQWRSGFARVTTM